MNAEEFKYKWGGEDWDLLDRVVNAQLEVERIKYPGLYHHYHTKQENVELMYTATGPGSISKVLRQLVMEVLSSDRQKILVKYHGV